MEKVFFGYTSIEEWIIIQIKKKRKIPILSAVECIRKNYMIGQKLKITDFRLKVLLFEIIF